MNQKEQQRVMVLNGVERADLIGKEAAELMGLSVRQVRRLVAAYRKEGVAAIAHGNRGRRPVHAVRGDVRELVVALAQHTYAGFNHYHLTEMLSEREGLTLSRTTVRRILLAAGLKSPKRRRPPKHRCRRERYPQEGMLLQIDGSEHDWLEGRGPWLTLLLAVDDATGTIPYAVFREQEDTHGYFLLLGGIAERRGIPLALYNDGHSVFRPARRRLAAVENLEIGERGLTQFGRALRELGIEQILARSPEAKGRVERAAGTFQDRLVAELRLARASTLGEANRILWQFLPGFNGRFGVPPAQPGCAYRPVSPDLDLAGILCFKYGRKVARDNTVKYNWRALQLLPSPERPSYAGVRVEVQERLDGSLVVCYHGCVISTQEAPPRPGTLGARSEFRGNESITTLMGLAGGVTPDDVGGQGKDWVQVLCATREGAAVGSLVHVRDGGARRLKAPHTVASPRRAQRRPTQRQNARWNAIQKAKRRGLSLRAIARHLGISRNTVRKYVDADSPPTYPVRRPRLETILERSSQPAGVP